jgi:outer membrane immunogenic protein
VTSERYRQLATVTGVAITNTVDDTRWGGVVGVGLEYGFAPNWSAGIEYNHMFMQDKTHTFTDTTGVFFGTERIRQDVDVVTARVNYRWGGPVVAKY